MKNNFKQKLSNVKIYVKEHKKDFVMLGIGLAVGTATIVFTYKLHLEGMAQRSELEAEGKKILKTFLNQTTIEGSGPIWDKLRDIFKNETMKPGDIWMIEADDIGKKVIAHIVDGPLEIIEF